MRSRELTRQLQVLEGLIDQSRSLHEDLDLLGHWGRYLCVVAAGFLENSLREIWSGYVRLHADPTVARFAQVALERISNPKAETFITTTERFDPQWAALLRTYLEEDDGRRKNAIDSLMANRHQIAHGRSVGISVARVREYLTESAQVIQYLEDLCA